MPEYHFASYRSQRAANNVREFDHGYTWLQPVFLACDLLLGTTTGSQHQYKRDERSDVEGKIADCAKPHEINLPFSASGITVNGVGISP